MNGIQYAARVRVLVGSLRIPDFADECEDSYRAGIPPEDCAAGLLGFTPATGAMNAIAAPESVGKGATPEEHAARLVRDYGRAGAVIQCSNEIWKHRDRSSFEFRHWAAIHKILNR